jgi:hypothetical protein
MKCGCTITNLKSCVSLWSDSWQINHKEQRTQALVGKFMATVFWDVVGVIHVDFFEPGTVSVEADTLQHSDLWNNNWQGFKGTRRMFCCKIELLGHTLHMPLWEEFRGWISPSCHILHTVWTCRHSVFMSFQKWKKTFVDIVFKWSSGKDCQNLVAETLCGVVLWWLYGTFLSLVEVCAIIRSLCGKVNIEN